MTKMGEKEKFFCDTPTESRSQESDLPSVSNVDDLHSPPRGRSHPTIAPAFPHQLIRPDHTTSAVDQSAPTHSLGIMTQSAHYGGWSRLQGIFRSSIGARHLFTLHQSALCPILLNQAVVCTPLTYFSAPPTDSQDALSLCSRLGCLGRGLPRLEHSHHSECHPPSQLGWLQANLPRRTMMASPPPTFASSTSS